MLPHIQLNSLSLNRGARQIFAGITLAINAGERVAIVGPSGIGKSSLLQIIAGLARPSSGAVTIGGQPVTAPPAAVTMMLQRPALLPWATVLDNVMLGLRFSGAARTNHAAAVARATNLLRNVGLADRINAKPFELSGGEQQRVALARALAPKPSVLLLDEPFSALDPVTRSGLRRDVAAIAEAANITLLLVTHDLDDASVLCHRVIRLSGNPANIVHDEHHAKPLYGHHSGILQTAA